ncbi:MAG: nucleotidyl transferase AbiEii/AbiGii toxin family protein, partial [Verrucomicrobiota bacterium]
MNSFQPHLENLPKSQQQLWQQLKPVSELGFVLYGGTAIELKLGHRKSIDFDFFSEKKLGNFEKFSFKHP